MYLKLLKYFCDQYLIIIEFVWAILITILLSTTDLLMTTTPLIMLVVDDDEEEEDEEPKSCFKIAQNRVCCSLGCIFRYIGTPNFSEKVLWVYSHLKSEFFSDNIGQKLT